ncbi:MAG: SymE family type I addiction module toxin [Chitinophagaceae bacterium]|nr:SymE family type I addiction module toxin [Chitinophagaceae bacterium]
MATLHTPAAATRALKVGYKHHLRRRRNKTHCIIFPSLLLSGKWLQQQGFERGDRVQVACMAGRLEITVMKQ